jgi:pyrroloquinoline quinone (PQQ) biosynthesis protein C
MAFNPFIGRSQEWLGSQLEIAQQDYAMGKTIVSSGSGDVNNAKQVQATAEKRIEQLYKALSLIDPETYPAASITRNTVTRVAFT